MFIGGDQQWFSLHKTQKRKEEAITQQLNLCYLVIIEKKCLPTIIGSSNAAGYRNTLQLPPTIKHFFNDTKIVITIFFKSHKYNLSNIVVFERVYSA